VSPDRAPAGDGLVAASVGPALSSAGAGEAPPAADVPEPERYERRAVLGTGGMGRVVVVHDRRLARDVALKEVAPQADPRAAAALEARLEREASITARLEHPSIVPIYGAGRRPDGTLYYTMRVVRGRSLADEAREADEEARRGRLLRHVLAAAQALAWAHRHGVVHRDLKPANIMVGELGETQVVDWGLARLVGDTGSDAAAVGPAPASDDGALTAHGAVVGTPHYMSPEQAMGQPADARADVWALGFVLYEVATGRPARPTPSASEALALARTGEPRLALGELPPDLGAIVARATALRLEGRYPDAKALADDLAAWLDGRRVAAHRYSTWQLVRRVVVAWRVPLGVAAVALVALAVAIGVGFSNTAAERDRAAAAERSARAALARAERDLGRAQVAHARALTDRGERPEAEVIAAEALTHGESAEARGILAAWGGEPGPQLVRRVALPPCRALQPAPDGATALCLEDDEVTRWDLGRGVRLWRVAFATPWVLGLEGAGFVLAGSGDEATTARLDLTTGAALPSLPTCCLTLHADRRASTAFGTGPRGLTRVGADASFEDLVVPAACTSLVAGFDDERGRRFVALCHDGRWVASGEGGVERARGSVDASEGEHGTAGAFVPGRDEVVIGTNRGRVVRLDVGSGRVLVASAGGVGVIDTIQPSDDGDLVAVRDEARAAALWDTRTGVWRGRLPARDDRGLRAVPGHPRRFMTWGEDGLSVWDLPVARAAVVPVGGGVSALDLSDDGRSVVVAAGTGVELRDLGDGRLVKRLNYPGVVKGVVMGPEDSAGRRFAAAPSRGRSGTGLVAGDSVRDVGVDGFTRRLVPFGAEMLRARDWGALTLLGWDGEERPLPQVATWIDVAVTADARRAATLDADRTVLVLDLEMAPAEVEVGRDSAWRAVAPSNDRERVACLERAGVSLVRLDGSPEAWLAAEPGAELIEVTWSADDRWVAAGARRGAVYLWDVASRRLAAVLREHDERVAALAFDTRGRWLVSGGWDATVRFAELARLDATPEALAAELWATWDLAYDALLDD